jgi:hypothetical protein
MSGGQSAQTQEADNMSKAEERKFIVIKHPFLNAKEFELFESELELDLKTMQKIVGGYIQRLPMRLASDTYLNAIVDEEGLLKAKELNCAISMRGRMSGFIHGTIMVCATSDAEFVPLTLQEARETVAHLNRNIIEVD